MGSRITVVALAGCLVLAGCGAANPIPKAARSSSSPGALASAGTAAAADASPGPGSPSPSPLERVTEPTPSPLNVVQPLGIPLAYGWDGVDSQRMIWIASHGDQLDRLVWTFNGSKWSSGPAPAATYGGILAYDAGRGREVLLSGAYYAGISQTWEWDGHSWRSINTSHTPPVGTKPSASVQAYP